MFLMDHYSSENIVNVGVGDDLTNRELTEMVREVVGFAGTIGNDTSKHGGTPCKLLDVSRLSALGWHARIPLRDVSGQNGARFTCCGSLFEPPFPADC